jgi:hypothetical protein
MCEPECIPMFIIHHGKSHRLQLRTHNFLTEGLANGSNPQSRAACHMVHLYVVNFSQALGTLLEFVLVYRGESKVISRKMQLVGQSPQYLLYITDPGRLHSYCRF